MSKTDTYENLHWLLMKANLKAKQQVMRMAEEHDLTVMQMYSIFLLEPGVQVPMNSISGLLSCDPSNVTAIVDRLVAGKYIERHESLADRRIKAIGLTDAGTSFRMKMLERLETENAPDLSALTDAEKKSMKKILLKVLGEKGG